MNIPQLPLTPMPWLRRGAFVSPLRMQFGSSSLPTLPEPLEAACTGSSAWAPAPHDPRLQRRVAAGLIVDLDDTLYPHEQFVMSGFAAVALYLSRTYGIARDRAFVTMARAHAGGRRGQEFQALCRAHRLPLSLVSELVTVFREHRPSLWLAPAVIATLRTLRQDGWRIAVLTNGLPSVQAAKVKALDLAPHVDDVVYAESCCRGGKPARAAFDAALTRLGVPADRCLCVGDDAHCDIDGAHRAGIRAVHLARPGAQQHPAADAVIHAFEHLPVAAASLIQLVSIDVA